MLKDWWQGLTDREQRVVSIGGVVAFILLLYLFAWTPLSAAVDDQRETLQRQVRLMTFLQHAATQINQLRASGAQANADDTQDITTLVEGVFSSDGIIAFVKQVQQPKQDQVTYILTAVPFDKLMSALHKVARSGVRVVQFSASRKSESGLADIQITLSKVG